MTTVSTSVIPRGEAGTRATLARMRALALAGVVVPIVRAAASVAVRYIPAADPAAQLAALRDWIEDRILFMRDPAGDVELLHAPELILRMIRAQGIAQVDCDDVAIFAATLASAIGYRTRFLAVAFARRDVPDRDAPFAHVWAEAWNARDKAWADFDITRPNQPTARVVRLLEYPVA